MFLVALSPLEFKLPQLYGAHVFWNKVVSVSFRSGKGSSLKDFWIPFLQASAPRFGNTGKVSLDGPSEGLVVEVCVFTSSGEEKGKGTCF